MKDLREVILNFVVNFILNQIKSGGIQRLACSFQEFVIPEIQSFKQDVFARLKARAAADGNPEGVNDAVVQAADLFFEALIPKGSQCQSVMSK